MATPFNAQRLKAVREIRQVTLSSLAREAGISTAALSRYERGDSLPPRKVAGQLGQALGVPVGCFYRSATPTTPPDTEIYYRRHSRLPTKIRRRAERLGAVFREFVASLEDRQILKIRPTELPDLSGYTPEDAAGELRRTLGFNDGPIGNMVELLEWFGIWVYQLQESESDKLDAFSYWHNGTAHVVLNPAKKDPYRSRFDCGHEAAHLLRDSGRDEDSREQEKEADRFAAEFLVPASAWLEDAPRHNVTDPATYLPMKRVWGVSVACLLYRSRELGVITQNQHRYAMMNYSSLGWRRGEPELGGHPPRKHEQPSLRTNCLKRMRLQGLSGQEVISELGYGPEILAQVLGVDLTIENLVDFTPPKHSAERPKEQLGGVVLNMTR